MAAEEILIIDADRHDADGNAQLVLRHPRDAEDAFLDGQHLALGIVGAFRIEAEGNFVVEAVDDFLEGVEVLGHLRQAVALPRDGQDAQPAQDLGDLGVREDVGAGAEDDRLAAEQDQGQERVHQGRAVVGGQDDGTVLRDTFRAFDVDGAEAGPGGEIDVFERREVALVLFPDFSHSDRFYDGVRSGGRPC